MTALETAAPWLRCPVCGTGLAWAGRSLVCPTGHVFDVAKQGYVNLVGHSAPSNADTVAMVAARHRFLSAGHYDHITDAVAEAVLGARRLLEVGAGTGHHLARVLDHLPSAHGLAADISVPASRRAAKAHPRMAAVVADTWAGLPLADRSVDAVLCLFAPRNPAEFQRVLADDGVVVVVLPKPDHLRELRDAHALLEVGEDKVDKLLQSSSTHLNLVASTDVTHELELSADEATDLVAMGPNAFHTNVSAPAIRTRLSVTCLTFRVLHTPRR
ncbi:MAG: methyltransferase domain-containing protein [Propionibacteriaceae bacterium]|nr:methyltransferase domain-containing protein [Propionibacteriaceae bacterium]